MKWKTNSTIILTISAVILGSCWSRDVPEPKSLEPVDPFAVQLEIKTNLPEPNYLRVLGKTNMPDDFVMQIRVCRWLVYPQDAHSEKITRPATCGASTYLEIREVKVKDGVFDAAFQVLSVEETKQIQSNYIATNPDRDIRKKVPSDFVELEVGGYPNMQNDKIKKLMGGERGVNLFGPHVFFSPRFHDGEDYKWILWETKLKI